MLEIHYRQDGKAYCDFTLLQDAQNIILEFINGKSNKRIVSTGNIIDALRVLVSRGELSHKDICFVFNDEKIFLNESVQCSHYPNGFIDYEDKFLDEILIKRLGNNKTKI